MRFRRMYRLLSSMSKKFPAASSTIRCRACSWDVPQGAGEVDSRTGIPNGMSPLGSDSAISDPSGYYPNTPATMDGIMFACVSMEIPVCIKI